MCAHDESETDQSNPSVRNEDSDGYFDVYDSSAHGNVDIGCQNLQNNDILENSIDFDEPICRTTIYKPVISVAGKMAGGPAVPQRRVKNSLPYAA